MNRYFFLLLFISQVVAAQQFDAYYPSTITLKQINSSDKERVRHAQGMRKFDNQPTGFYIEAGKTIVVDIQIDHPAADGELPFLAVGTPAFNNPPPVRGRTIFKLSAGVNRITPTHPGLIWLGFTTDRATEPSGVAQVTFTNESQHVRAPHYIHNTTTEAEFREMVNIYPTDDVIFHSDYSIVCASRQNVINVSLNPNPEPAEGNPEGVYAWMTALNRLIEMEDEISGMDDNDPNPVHHRLKAGEVRFLLVETNTGVAFTTQEVTYYNATTVSGRRFLRTMGVTSNSWMVGHEVGHQHQQPAYQISQATESTVNIYSYVVDRNWVESTGATFNRTSAQRWQQAQNTYLKIPVSKRIYDMPDADLQAITGFDVNELRFMMWEQLFLIFGDQFYKTLHRVVREEKVLGGGADERRAYLIWKSSQITGYDLTDFFNLWGIRVNDSNEKALLRARIFTALTRGEIQPLPRPVQDLVMVTGQQRPSWTPMPLKGITSSAPINEGLDRTAWTITVSTDQRIYEAGIGADKPEYIIDESLGTVFSFIKPGKSYDDAVGPPDYIPSFTIDMKDKHEFNYFIYRHRTGNNSEFIRARKISFYGKNAEGEDFAPIVENVVIDYVQNKDEIKVNFNKVEYRYLQVVINDWNRSSGSTIQIADFNVGVENKEDLLTPDPYHYKVKVDAGNGVVASPTGEFNMDEDSELTVQLTLLPGYHNLSVTVDGDSYQPQRTGDVYVIKYRISNHTSISITAVMQSFTVKLNRGEGVTLIAPESSVVDYGKSFQANFSLAAGFANPTITGGDGSVVIEGNTIRIPSITSNMELTLSASKPTGVSENLRQTVKVYPNPVISGQTLTIEMDKLSGILKISRADGKLLEQKTITGGTEKIKIDYTPGVYFLNINANGAETACKIVVQ